MEDISQLPEYVSSTAVFLAFLSRNYLKSINCLIEVAAASKLQAPLVLCHHARLETGGAPMKTLLLECPAEHSDYLFGVSAARRPVIPWVRQPDYELESLKQITIATIIGCENRRGEAIAARGAPRHNASKAEGAPRNHYLNHHLKSGFGLNTKTLPQLMYPNEIGLFGWKLPVYKSRPRRR